MKELSSVLGIIVSNNISTIKNNSEVIKALLEEQKQREVMTQG